MTFQMKSQKEWQQLLLYPDALETLNRWYDEGHVICFFTSRTEDHRAVTEEWLNQ